MTTALSWAVNIGAVIGWLVNIKWRKRAMVIFTVTTLLSVVYFALTEQTPFLLRSLFYLGIDVVTLWNIHRNESQQ